MNPRFRDRPQPDEHRTAAANQTKRGQRRRTVSECLRKHAGNGRQNADDMFDAPSQPPEICRPVKQLPVNAGFFGQDDEIGRGQHLARRFRRQFASGIPGVRLGHENNFFYVGKRSGKPRRKTVRKKTESDVPGAAWNPRDFRSFRNLAGICAVPCDAAVRLRMDRASECHTEFPRFRPNIFFGGQFCRISHLHIGSVSQIRGIFIETEGVF